MKIDPEDGRDNVGWFSELYRVGVGKDGRVVVISMFHLKCLYRQQVNLAMVKWDCLVYFTLIKAFYNK